MVVAALAGGGVWQGAGVQGDARPQDRDRRGRRGRLHNPTHYASH